MHIVTYDSSKRCYYKAQIVLSLIYFQDCIKRYLQGFHCLLLQPKTGTLADTLKEEHIIIILVIFCLILSGMCFTFVFNCVRKLIRDHRIIQVSVTRCLVAPKLVHDLTIIQVSVTRCLVSSKLVHDLTIIQFSVTRCLIVSKLVHVHTIMQISTSEKEICSNKFVKFST